MYLYGDITSDGVIIAGMTIPVQEISGGSVDNIEAPLPGCIGTIHSHNSMGAFHSGIDETYIQSNHKVCITVNNKLEFAATVDILSECKRPMRIQADVMLQEPEINLVEFLKEADEKIREHVYTHQVYPYSYESKVWKDGRWVDKENKEVDTKKGIGCEDSEKVVKNYMEYWG